MKKIQTVLAGLLLVLVLFYFGNIGLNCDFSVTNIRTFFQKRRVTLRSGNTEDNITVNKEYSSREKETLLGDIIKDQDIIQDQELRLWMDVPNDFPWRKCITDYSPGLLLTTDCHLWE